jgi:acyl-CoA oxidase
MSQLQSPTAESLTKDPRGAAVAPLLYVAWSDSQLTASEIERIRSAIMSCDGLDAAAMQNISGWLDPKSPPSAVELGKLLSVIRAGAPSLSPKERRSLASLGLELAELEHDLSADDPATKRLEEALLGIEKALGIASEDAVRALLRSAPWPVEDSFAEAAPPFDPKTLSALVLGPHHDTWQRVKLVLERKEFRLDPEDASTSGQRTRVLGWLKLLSAEGLGALAMPKAQGGSGDMRAFIAAFEALAMFDLSLAVKFGVQFGLFGGSVLALGTGGIHQRHLGAIGRGEMLGGFAMTELGHGSNVREIETIARYDAARKVFVLDTPTESARKEWIGNAAVDGRFMTVFAQLEVAGQRHGVHALLVRVRNDDGSPVPGVRIEDCGRKMGLNGVDNGRLWFSAVDVPRDQLLDRFGGVDEAGDYKSDIASANKRFFTMLGTLVGGRISVAAAANTAAKVALTIAIRYGALRRQFGPVGAPEIRILDYPEHQLRLFPRVAQAIGTGYAIQALGQRFADAAAGEDREIETLAAALKALATRSAIDSIQACRECCGGMGFLEKNRISQLRTDVDVFATFEGDNTVLLQLAAKSLLTDFRQQLGDDVVTTTLGLLKQFAAATLKYRNPVGARRTDRDHLVDPEFHQNAFGYREETLLVSAARRIKRRVDAGMDVFAAFNAIQDHLLALARAMGERLIVEHFATGVQKAKGPEREILDKLYGLHALVRMREDLAFFAENGYVEPAKARAIRKLVVDLCAELRPHAVAVVRAFDIPESCISAPIAFDGYVKSPDLA